MIRNYNEHGIELLRNAVVERAVEDYIEVTFRYRQKMSYNEMLEESQVDSLRRFFLGYFEFLCPNISGSSILKELDARNEIRCYERWLKNAHDKGQRHVGQRAIKTRKSST